MLSAAATLLSRGGDMRGTRFRRSSTSVARALGGTGLLACAVAAAAAPSYRTTFGSAENPLSEAGAWSNIDDTRTRMAAAGGRCFGTQSGGAYDDSVAQLVGSW